MSSATTSPRLRVRQLVRSNPNLQYLDLLGDVSTACVGESLLILADASQKGKWSLNLKEERTRARRQAGAQQADAGLPASEARGSRR